MQQLPSYVIEKGQSYAAYYQLCQTLYEQGTTTSGLNSEDILAYTHLNLHRMKRIYEKNTLIPELVTTVQQLKKVQNWFVLTESWCGDAAQLVPILAKIAENSNGKIQFYALLREENPEIMNAFLTKGGKAIPKLIITDAQLNVLANWGPRPAVLQEMYWKMKKEQPEQHWKEQAEVLHNWYTKDKTITTQQEILQLIKIVAVSK
jgi:thiol-disulfide isomerase/thioredoxin